ncbi:UbiX family flavin prenyltransferase [Maledivibacter halophilus]|uniref:Flavin prenyltransferase UbiX n=1 Tax=Maledivibacter halophilus TaxID=36842 RepID=A0A1T5IRC2_9FIRM|nr:flavin prenyltransferase UbiX [Maledivibacter halophilus]SKC41686.1 4-hydroxy-3-polyprenylbenzoate decarboxylase [Maledivibacter halophilus]
MGKYIVGITGASGSVYGVRLVEELLKKDNEVFLVVTANGEKVLEYELDIDFIKWTEKLAKDYGRINICNIDDMFSKIASGSFRTDGMVIAPCSMGSLSKISNGITDSLLIRAADVMIKEKRKLILVPRETPFNSIHLKNMLFLSKLNVTILPPIPGFYNKPKTLSDIIDNMVGRILCSLNIENDLYCQWNGDK